MHVFQIYLTANYTYNFAAGRWTSAGMTCAPRRGGSSHRALAVAAAVGVCGY